MTGWYIFFGIIAFLLFLLLCPLRFYLEYDDEVRFKVGYLFLRFTIMPPKPKKKKKSRKKASKKDSGQNAEEEKKQKDKKQKKPNPIVDFTKKHGIDGLIELLEKLVSIVIDVLKKTARHLVINRLYVKAVIVGNDSADTALKYGYTCSAVYPLLSVLDSNCRMRAHSEDICAGFLAEKTAVYLNLKARIRPLFLIGIAVPALIRLIVAIAKIR